MKRFFLIGFAMLVVAVIATIVVWYLLQGSLPQDVEEATEFPVGASPVPVQEE